MQTYEVVTWDTRGKRDPEDWEEHDSQRVTAIGSYQAALAVSGDSGIEGMSRPAGPGVFFQGSHGKYVYEVLTLFTAGSGGDQVGAYRKRFEERRGYRP